ncbi:MAG TPA: RDD family protein [Mycobacteriales bacterium]|nr:RDD family protein [Mycobacteriales bacterium]
MTNAPRYGEPLVTGEAVAVDIRTAGIGSRAVAVVIDFAVQFGLAFVLVLLVDRLGTSMDSAGAVTFVLVSYVLLILGYPVGFETLWRGRTPGKAALGLRVTRDDGGPIRFRHAFVRGLVGVVVERPGLFFLPALLCMLINSRSKRLGDLAAGTIVVQERVPARVATPTEMPPALAGWAATLDLTRIDDQLAWEVRQFLSRAGQLTPSVRDQLAHRLVAEVAGRTSPPPPGAPGWAYLSAVLAERRRRELERVSAPTAPAEAATQPPPPASPTTGFVPPA